MIAQNELKRLLTYNKETGLFVWNISRRCIRSGSNAGCVSNGFNGNKYIKICVNNKDYLAHRLAFIYMNGDLSQGHEIDHINGNGLDNRWVNLREVSRINNMRNSKLYKNSSSGVCGVNWVKSEAKWYAKIMVNYKNIYLGSFANKEDAIKKRKEAERHYGFHENHGRQI